MKQRMGFYRAGIGRQPFKTFVRLRHRPRFRSVPQRATRRTFTGRTAGNGHKMGEWKFHDIDINDASVAQNGTILEDSCNTIAQGVTESQRIGRKCTIRSINWRFRVLLTGQTDVNNLAAAADTVRVILYLDKQANGAAAGVTDILESDDFQSFNNLANKSRFRTLMDRVYDLSASAGAGTSAAAANDTGPIFASDAIYKKCNIPIEYSSTTGAITEVTSNNIGVLILAAAGARTSFDSKMRLRFSDT